MLMESDVEQEAVLGEALPALPAPNATETVGSALDQAPPDSEASREAGNAREQAISTPGQGGGISLT